jgi:hypothetical protein
MDKNVRAPKPTVNIRMTISWGTSCLEGAISLPECTLLKLAKYAILLLYLANLSGSAS